MPAAGARVLFLGAEPGFRLPDGFDCELSLVQGFRPDFLALQREGHRVGAAAEGDGYAAALVLCNRHRGHNELAIAEALERVVPMAGWWWSPAARRTASPAWPSAWASWSRSTGRRRNIMAWPSGFMLAADRLAVAGELRRLNPPVLIDGRFETAPGMFSHGRIDPGSRLLAEALPADLSGKVADFCAGWGYLSAELIERCARVTSVDLYEADHAVAGSGTPQPCRRARRNRVLLARPVAEPVEARYDAIVMNPPFHQGRAAEPGIGSKLIAVAAKALKSRGSLYLVANKGLPYERDLAASFAEYRQMASDKAFKVFVAPLAGTDSLLS